MAAETLWS